MELKLIILLESYNQIIFINMIEISVTEFARNLRTFFNKIEYQGEEIILIRNNNIIAKIIPGSAKQTALQVMSDLYETIPEDAAKDWLSDSELESRLKHEMRNPWDS